MASRTIGFLAVFMALVIYLGSLGAGYLLTTWVTLPNCDFDRLEVPEAEVLHLKEGNGTTQATIWPSQWYAEDAEGSRHHVTHKARMKYFDQQLSSFPSKGRFKQILEIGSGDGLVAEGLAALGYKTTAVDIALPFLEHAHRGMVERKVENLKYFQGDATELPFVNNTFDGVVMADVLEHIPDLQKAVSEARRVLKAGGVLVVSTLDRSLGSYLLHGFLSNTMPGYPTEGHDWRMYVRPEELQRALEGAGLQPRMHSLTALLPTFNPLHTALYNPDQPWHHFIGDFFSVRLYLPILNTFSTKLGPYLMSAIRPAGDVNEEELYFFPASVQNEDGTIEHPSASEIEACTVEYDQIA